MTLKEYCKANDITTKSQIYKLVEAATYDSICPAICADGCEVEPDGTCEHGGPSLLLALGYI